MTKEDVLRIEFAKRTLEKGLMRLVDVSKRLARIELACGGDIVSATEGVQTTLRVVRQLIDDMQSTLLDAGFSHGWDEAMRDMANRHTATAPKRRPS